MTIPYDKDIISVANRNKNVGLNTTEKKVLSHLLEKQESTADKMVAAIGVTKRTIERTLKKLVLHGNLWNKKK